MASTSNKRNFSDWLATFRDSIADYHYYIDFEKVYANVSQIKVPLCILNSLVGSKDIEREFVALLKQYPTVLPCIPILLAVRDSEIKITDSLGHTDYDFAHMSLTAEQYAVFMKRTGLFDLLSEHIVHDLVDYVTGVETGLDSNGRKNRGGHAMENLVEQYLQKAGLKRELNYFKEVNVSAIQAKHHIDMSNVSNQGRAEKRFDFVVKTCKGLFVIETNFYASSGSKLNETARSYKTLALEIAAIPGVTFVWFTDGKGWNAAKNNLEETFDVLDTIFNINDLERGVAASLFV